MEHLDLFTPVEQGLPEDLGKEEIWIVENHIGERYKTVAKTIDLATPYYKRIAWLDLSKLTTKERAEEAIYKAYCMPNRPFDDYQIPDLDKLYESL